MKARMLLVAVLSLTLQRAAYVQNDTGSGNSSDGKQIQLSYLVPLREPKEGYHCDTNH